jgi:serine protease Do
MVGHNKTAFRKGALLGAGGAAALGAALFVSGAAATAAQAPRLISPPAAHAAELSFADLVERVSPAVVSVLVERKVETQGVPQVLEDFFQYRFGQRPNDQQFDDGEQLMEAQGSGFFIDAEHIVTNNHVIEEASEIKVRLNNGREVTATLVGADPLTDLAVLKVTPVKGQAFVQFADEVDLRVGDWVLAVGNPFGLGGSVTSGIVSAIGGESRSGQFMDFIQIDAPINRGNSGGPTFDLKGRVVGVNTAIYSPNGGSVGIGFAIPAKTAKETVAQLIKSGSVTRGWLGVAPRDLDDTMAAALGRKSTDGALVNEVVEGTPAARAGVEAGDLIVRVNDRAIKSAIDLTRTISSLPPGAKARVVVIRGGSEKLLNVTLGQRDADQQAAAEPDKSGKDDSLATDVGMRVAGISDQVRAQFRIPESITGVVVTAVKPGSAAADAGLQPGVVILSVDGAAVASPAALKAKIAEAKKAGKSAILMRMQLGEAKQFGALALK